MKAATTHATDDNADQLSLPSPHKAPDSLRFLFYSFSGLTLPSWNRVPIFFPSVCIVCCSLFPMKQLSNNYYRTPTKRNGPSDENILDLESTTYEFFFIEFILSVIWLYIETHYSGNKLILILFLPLHRNLEEQRLFKFKLKVSRSSTLLLSFSRVSSLPHPQP